MRLLSTLDALLRDREALYREAEEAGALGRLFGRLLLIFVLTSALYGLGMGGFRWLHPSYRFSDFELSCPDGGKVQGGLAGMNVETRTIYTLATNLPAAEGGEVRFNLTRPSEPYPVRYTTEEKGYGAVVLGPGPALEEPAAWVLPLLVTAKTPLLFLCTLLVCAPALYVLNLVYGARLAFMPTLTVVALGLAATGALLAVFMPIAALFSVVTADYHFVKLMHVLVFAIAGIFGVRVMGEGLSRITGQRGLHLSGLVCAWLLLYCVVGGQLAWTLKPFLGTPYLPATPPFRVESGNIYVSVLSSIGRMGFGGERPSLRVLDAPKTAAPRR